MALRVSRSVITIQRHPFWLHRSEPATPVPDKRELRHWKPATRNQAACALRGLSTSMRPAAHIRIAECGTFYALPAASHGIFVGGGGSVRVPRLIDDNARWQPIDQSGQC